eukprot:181672-Amphidinium_carterae.1
MNKYEPEHQTIRWCMSSVISCEWISARTHLSARVVFTRHCASLSGHIGGALVVFDFHQGLQAESD